jgi:hypothetical protein
MAIDGYLVISGHCLFLKAFASIGTKHGLFYGDNQAKKVRQSGGRVIALLHKRLCPKNQMISLLCKFCCVPFNWRSHANLASSRFAGTEHMWPFR